MIIFTMFYSRARSVCFNRPLSCFPALSHFIHLPSFCPQFVFPVSGCVQLTQSSIWPIIIEQVLCAHHCERQWRQENEEHTIPPLKERDVQVSWDVVFQTLVTESIFLWELESRPTKQQRRMGFSCPGRLMYAAKRVFSSGKGLWAHGWAKGKWHGDVKRIKYDDAHACGTALHNTVSVWSTV